MSTGNEEQHTRVVAGRYRLRSVLGSGSMGTVWSAYDDFLQRPVAVKEVRLPHGVPATQADELRERTLREARAIAVLSHPNVIILHDVARENGEPFVVMELLPSHSLAELLRRHGKLGVEQAAAVGDAVAAALEAAHAAGITHRDVKPGNVLVAPDGRIKLTDFGIARNVSEATMTKTGMTLGSPAYIAPEVASGGAVSPAADLWGLGATVFAAVEGHPPYDADGDPLETMGKVVHGAVPKPSPGPLAPLIERLMAKEPGDRITLREFRQRLRPLLVKAPHALFGPELFQAQNAAADTAFITSPARDEPPGPAPEAAPAAPALAADPGPLPFQPAPAGPPPATPAPPKPRSALVTATLTVVAILLFLAASAGGFVAARSLGGQPILPPEAEKAPAPTAPPLKPLATRSGDATNYKGVKGGLFSIQVPENWVQFVTQQARPGMPPSSLVQFVSVDGKQVLNVERFAGSCSEDSLDEYRQSLEVGWPRGDFESSEATRLTNKVGIALTYTTVERANGRGPSAPSLSRTTFAQAFCNGGSSLWAISVTVPTEQSDVGRNALFDRIVPTFTAPD
ncbi:serine/threonine-protein kinase [Amycolatopsis anabasis]|uniref:serine/threonine-protein kinase n=1 Tax=Amycolatopsis anabasis TaxID=1840409 RepID=UPI00131A8EEC|nr:serine/threonine-protein kinase [Amycolatopsis anabasis]